MKRLIMMFTLASFLVLSICGTGFAEWQTKSQTTYYTDQYGKHKRVRIWGRVTGPRATPDQKKWKLQSDRDTLLESVKQPKKTIVFPDKKKKTKRYNEYKTPSQYKPGEKRPNQKGYYKSKSLDNANQRWLKKQREKRKKNRERMERQYKKRNRTW